MRTLSYWRGAIIEDVILTEDEVIQLCDGCPDEFACGGCKERDKKAQLKLLDWLNEQGLIRCDFFLEYEEYLSNGKDWHKPDCRVCNLRKELEGK